MANEQEHELSQSNEIVPQNDDNEVQTKTKTETEKSYVMISKLIDRLIETRPHFVCAQILKHEAN